MLVLDSAAGSFYFFVTKTDEKVTLRGDAESAIVMRCWSVRMLRLIAGAALRDRPLFALLDLIEKFRRARAVDP